MTEYIPGLFYIAGSLCFIIGTVATPDTYPVGIPVPLQVVTNRYDEDTDNHVVTMKGKEDGDQVTFRVPPGMAKMFPLEMTVDATVNFEVLA
jgi:hypothetical protein